MDLKYFYRKKKFEFTLNKSTEKYKHNKNMFELIRTKKFWKTMN